MTSSSLFTIVFCCFITAAKGDNSVACHTCNCSHDDTFGGVLVRCSGRGLSEVPAKIPADASTLLLDGNNFTKLVNKTFLRLKRLKRLDMSRNHLHMLAEDAFNGLGNLEQLNLESNCLTLDNSTFTKHLFVPLSKLLILKLNNNTNPMYLPPWASYPDSSFQYLSSLQELYIDGLPTDFGPGFLNLTNLKTLSLSGSNGYCTLPVLRNSTFVHVPRVEMLNVSNCLTTDTEAMAFSDLKNIHTLDVSSNNRLGFANFSTSTYGLQTSSIKVLKVNNIYPLYGSCSRLEKKHVVYLNNTSLRELYMDGNGIIGFEQGTIMNLPSSLEVLSARENRFSFGIYLFELINMKALHYLDITYLNKWRTSPGPFKRDVTRLNSLIPILFPPQLETFIFSKCYVRGVLRFPIANKYSMKKFVGDHNLIWSISAPIYGFEKLEYVDLSHNRISNIDFGLFSNCSVTYLDLSYNALGDCFSKDGYGKIFENLSKVQYLNISANRINILSRHMFKGLHQLETLIISFNELDNFDIDLKHMSHLKYVDLRNNKLQSLSISVQNDLDHLSNVTVQLNDNMLSCTCLNLDFVRWMRRNRLLIQDLHTTQCILANAKHVNLTDLDKIVNNLENQCRSDIVVLVTSVSLFILIMIIIFGFVGYRYRWRLRRMYYVGRRMRNQISNDEQDMYEYVYDAFVSYAAADRGFVKNSMIPELEQKAGLKLCVHDRDFIPGTVIASNIANAIQNSRKTLILLSPSFLESEWCQYEYNIARAEGVSRRENVVVGVLYRPVPLNDMPGDMALLFAQYSYLEYDMDGHDDEIFWQNIIDGIKTPETNDD